MVNEREAPLVRPREVSARRQPGTSPDRPALGGTFRQQVLATRKVRARQARQGAAGEELSPLPASYLDATQDRPHAPWRVERAELRRFAEQRDKPSVVIGYDLTFSAPKSVSILWATATLG